MPTRRSASEPELQAVPKLSVQVGGGPSSRLCSLLEAHPGLVAEPPPLEGELGLGEQT